MKKFLKILLVILVVLILLPKPFLVGGVAGYNWKCLGYSFGPKHSGPIIVDDLYTGFCIGIPYK